MYMARKFAYLFNAPRLRQNGHHVADDILLGVCRSQGVVSPKGHFLSPDSLAKGIFLAKIP